MKFPKKKRRSRPVRHRALTSIQQYVKLAEAVVDEEEVPAGYCRCISCGKVKYWKEMDGGHFISRRERSIDTDLRNLHPQCRYCNRYKSGDWPMYRHNLIKKIGAEQVLALEYIVAARNGSEEAFNALSESDRLIVINEKTEDQYLEIHRYYQRESRRLRKILGD